MKKLNNNFVLGMLIGAFTVLLISFIYEKLTFKTEVEVPVHQETIFDEEIIGSIPKSYFTQTHVCELWETAEKEYADPSWVSGIFTYDFDIDRWIYCQ